MYTTGMFNYEYKLWKRKPTAEKDWAQFKIYFTIAHEELVESNQTAQATGFQVNNTAVQRDTVTAINNLANATIADRESMSALTITVSNKTVTLAEANEKIVSALAQITILTRDLGVARWGNPRGGPRTPAVVIDYRHYCWTHVPTCSHPS